MRLRTARFILADARFVLAKFIGKYSSFIRSNTIADMHGVHTPLCRIYALPSLKSDLMG